MPPSPRTAQPLFPRWVLLVVPLVALAALVLALTAGSGDDATRSSASDGAAGEDAARTPASDGAADEAVADALDEQAAAAVASGDDEAVRLGRRVEVLAAMARGDAPPRQPDWAAADLEPGESLQGAGTGFEAQAVGEQDPARLLRWLVLAEAERARVLDLGEVATGLEEVVVGLSEG